MKNFRFIAIFFLSILLSTGITHKTYSQVQTFQVGGKTVAIPSPGSEFSEVGDANRDGMKVFVPESNRLVSGFVLSTDLPKLFKTEKNDMMVRYALVEVPKTSEFTDCNTADFKDVVSGVDESLKNGNYVAESETEFNNRMKKMHLDSLQIRIGQPAPLGRFFYKQDVICLGMVMALELGGESARYAVAIMLIRVKQRLMFVYLYNAYENQESVSWLRKTAETWGDRILTANK